MRYPLQVTGTGADTVVFTHEKYRNNRTQGGGGQAGPPGAGASGDIILYMPNSTPSPNQHNDWNQQNFAGPLGEFLQDTALEGSKVLNNRDLESFTTEDGLRQTGKDLGSATGNIINSAMDNAGGIVKQLGTRALAGIGGFDNANQLLAMERGEIFNPNVELLYKGNGVRQFGFNYTFVPKSEQEAIQVNQIIMEFKKFSSPVEKGSYFEVPHVWNVRYMTNGGPNQNMNVFKKAALTNVAVGYNPGLDMHATFANGMPIILSLIHI